jgi:hypothetical protein
LQQLVEVSRAVALLFERNRNVNVAILVTEEDGVHCLSVKVRAYGSELRPFEAVPDRPFYVPSI